MAHLCRVLRGRRSVKVFIDSIDVSKSQSRRLLLFSVPVEVSRQAERVKIAGRVDCFFSLVTTRQLKPAQGFLQSRSYPRWRTVLA